MLKSILHNLMLTSHQDIHYAFFNNLEPIDVYCSIVEQIELITGNLGSWMKPGNLV